MIKVLHPPTPFKGGFVSGILIIIDNFNFLITISLKKPRITPPSKGGICSGMIYNLGLTLIFAFTQFFKKLRITPPLKGAGGCY
jgi:hypothetical protein